MSSLAYSWTVFGDFDDCPYSIRARQLLESRGEEVRCVRVPIGDRSSGTPYSELCSKYQHRQGRVPLIIRSNKRDRSVEFVGGFDRLASMF